MNGTTTTQSSNAANQVVGFSYDAAGNLLSDGTTTSTSDALGHTVSQGGTSYQYNGDGVLVAAGTIASTQDLVAPLSQMLNDGSANYWYGRERLANSTGTWYLSDALGSVRQTLDASGAVTASANYDPWGSAAVSTISAWGEANAVAVTSTGTVVTGEAVLPEGWQVVAPKLFPRLLQGCSCVRIS